VLADIYLGKIKKWNHDELKALNKGVDLPDKDIKVVHRSEPSGTTFVWTSYLTAVSNDWAKIGAAKDVKWPTGEGAKGNDGVANQVVATEGSIGYMETIYALDKKIQFGPVRNQAGKDVLASELEGLTAAAEAKLTDVPDNLCVVFVDAPGDKSYPICGVVWAVMYEKQPAERQKTLVEFLHWVTHDGQKLAPPLHYAMLPTGLVQRIDKKLDTIKPAK
jgi:phosphate transport system substrate-binding protein